MYTKKSTIILKVFVLIIYLWPSVLKAQNSGNTKFNSFQPLIIVPSLSTIHTAEQSVAISYINSDNITLINQTVTLKDRYRFVGYGLGLNYFIAKNTFFNILSIAEYGLISRTAIESGFNHQMNISSLNHRPIRLTIGLDYSFATIYQNLSTYHLTMGVDVAGKSFNNDLKIQLLSRIQGFKPKLGFNIELGKLITAYIDGGFFLNTKRKDILEFTEKSPKWLGKIFPKQQKITSSSNEFTMYSNGQSVSNLHFHKQITIQAGLRGFLSFGH